MGIGPAGGAGVLQTFGVAMHWPAGSFVVIGKIAAMVSSLSQVDLFAVDFYILVRGLNDPLGLHRVVAINQFPFPSRLGLEQLFYPSVTADRFFKGGPGNRFDLVRLDEDLVAADLDPLEAFDFDVAAGAQVEVPGCFEDGFSPSQENADDVDLFFADGQDEIPRFRLVGRVLPRLRPLPVSVAGGHRPVPGRLPGPVRSLFLSASGEPPIPVSILAL